MCGAGRDLALARAPVSMDTGPAGAYRSQLLCPTEVTSFLSQVGSKGSSERQESAEGAQRGHGRGGVSTQSHPQFWVPSTEGKPCTPQKKRRRLLSISGTTRDRHPFHCTVNYTVNYCEPAEAPSHPTYGTGAGSQQGLSETRLGPERRLTCRCKPHPRATPLKPQFEAQYQHQGKKQNKTRD